jgi:uncharacterized protein YggU (UPF0235/DUF167 family)
MSLPDWVRPVAGGCELRLKVVPGASRAGVAGPLGDRLKVRVAEPPEGGKANRAIGELLGGLLGCPCEVVAGHGTPLKTVLCRGAEAAAVAGLLS